MAIARADGVLPEELERVFAALEEFRGDPWRVTHLSLNKRVVGASGNDSAELDRIPIGSG